MNYKTSDGKVFEKRSYDSDLDVRSRAQSHQDELDRADSGGSTPARNINVTALYNKEAKEFYDKGEYDKAMDKLNVVMQKFRNPDAVTYSYLGMVHYAKNEYEKAIAAYTEALDRNLERDSSDGKEAVACAYNNRGIAYKAIGEYDKAIADLKMAISLAPGADYIKRNLARAEQAKAARPAQDSVDDRLSQASSLCNAERYEEAVPIFLELAKRGNAVAQYMLGAFYYSGDGVTKDLAAAAEWYRKAAEQGDAYAQNNLGSCYYYGEGVPKDYAKALEWFRKAAAQGNAEAQNNLGNCYYDGGGVPQDYARAAEWYAKAAALGNETARETLDKLKREGKI